MSESGSTSGAARRAVFIANPGARHLAKRRDALERAVDREATAAGIDARIVWTERPGQASEIAAQAARDGVELIFGCGGDGTLNEILNGLHEFAATAAPAVGIVPAGTVDVWAREAGIPRRDFAAAIRAQLSAAPLPIDLGLAGDRRFLLMASFGFDAAAVAAVNPALKRRTGPLAYAVAGLRVGWRDSGFSVDVGLDDDPPFRVHGSLLVAGNTRNYGGVAEITGRASAVDGRLDLVAFLGHGPITNLRLFPRLLLRRHLDWDRAVFRRAARIRLQPAPGELLPHFQLDGEFGLPPSPDPIELSVQPAAIRMLVAAADRPLFRPAPRSP